MFLSVSLHCLFSMPPSVNGVMSMVRRLFVMSRLVVFGCVPVMTGGV
jgi:hypothetical protein